MSRGALVWAEQRDSILLREALDCDQEVIAIVRRKTPRPDSRRNVGNARCASDYEERQGAD
jgi:hypothetical protein